jgi:serine/threonine protein kinase
MRCARSGTLPHCAPYRTSEALGRFLFQQLVLALDFCHRKGKVSRDVKLANTLLALAPGQLPLVKLCDFGYSKDTMQHSAPASQVRPAATKGCQQTRVRPGRKGLPADDPRQCFANLTGGPPALLLFEPAAAGQGRAHTGC